LTIIRKEGSGRKKVSTVRRERRVIALFEKNFGLSSRKVAQKVGCSEKLVRKAKKEGGLKTFKVQKVPDRNAAKN